MKQIRHNLKYLKQRGGWWHYVRRVPSRFASVDERGLVQIALHTDSLEIAKMRRDGLVEADTAMWNALSLEHTSIFNGPSQSLKIAEHRHRSAVARALSQGFVYRPVEELAAIGDIEDIVARFQATDANNKPSRAKAEALLGGVPVPEDCTTVMEAFKIYVTKIAFDDQYNKSEAQRRSWEKTKRTSIAYFVDQVGDLPLSEITREKAIEYRDWWQSRMLPQKDGSRPITPNTANRHIGNMRSLVERYFKYRGRANVENPFRDFYFSGKSQTKRASFSDEWVRSKVLVPGLFDGLRLELRVIIFLLIETGARLSEIVNLQSGDIRLNDAVPHIKIRPEQNRELKTGDSEREIPLVGAALIAMKVCPDGFPYYYDKSTLVSANLMKAFKQRKLLPSTSHVIYSFRHSFEDRMLEGGLDYGLRCSLMGHKNTRPEYGMGGALKYRRDELLKIAHPVPPLLFR